VPLPVEMWFLTKIQCCEKSQKRRIKHKVELQTVRQQTLRKRESSSQIALKGLKGQKRTPQIQMVTNRRLLKSNLDRWGQNYGAASKIWLGWRSCHFRISNRNIRTWQLKGSDRDRWPRQVDYSHEQEMKSLDRNQTWKLHNLLKNSKAIGR